MRLRSRELIYQITNKFYEFSGDKINGDDDSMIGGVGIIEDIPITIIAHNRLNEIENIKKSRNGMVLPSGHRKALRIIKQAEKFSRPILTIIDTPGAHPGVEAEKECQSITISNLISLLVDVKVPVVSIILSEGGSGGALALSLSDYMYAFENSYYSVISPEGYKIIKKDKRDVNYIALDMKIYPEFLKDSGIINEIIKEDELDISYSNIKQNIYDKINELNEVDIEKLVKIRKNKFLKVDDENNTL